MFNIVLNIFKTFLVKVKMKERDKFLIELAITLILSMIVTIIELPDVLFLILSVLLILNLFFIKKLGFRIIFLVFFVLLFLIEFFLYPLTIFDFLSLFSFSSFYHYEISNVIFFLFYMLLVIFSLIYIFEERENSIQYAILGPIIFITSDIIYQISLYCFTSSSTIDITLFIPYSILYTFFTYVLFYITLGLVYAAHKTFDYFINATGFTIKIKTLKTRK